MQTIPARVRYLRNAEAFCALALPAVFCFDWQGSDDAVAWTMRGAALVLVSYILAQGGLYWHLKLRSIMLRQPLPAYFQPLRRNGRLRRAALRLDLERHNVAPAQH